MSTGYIPDGYTRPGYIQAVPRLYDSLRFEYRPSRRITRAKHFRDLDKVKNDDDKSERVACDFIASRLVSWDAKNEEGESIPLSSATLGDLEPVLFERLYTIILGNAIPDEDPESPTPADKGEENNEKN